MFCYISDRLLKSDIYILYNSLNIMSNKNSKLSQAPYPIYLLWNIANITLLLEGKESGNEKIQK